MADVKISELPALTTSDGAEELVVNDGGTTKKITGTNLLAGYVSKNSTTGAASMPSGTTAQRPSGAAGLFRHNSTTDKFEGYSDGEWGEVGGGPSLGADSIIRVNNLTISEDISIPSTSNGMSAGPITIADGFTVTVNGTWSII